MVVTTVPDLKMSLVKMMRFCHFKKCRISYGGSPLTFSVGFVVVSRMASINVKAEIHNGFPIFFCQRVYSEN